MNSGRTSRRMTLLLSRPARGFAALALIPLFIAYPASAQQRRSSDAAKSNEPSAQQREDIGALLREAAGLLQAGRLDEAELLLRRALKSAPSNPDAHNLLGAVLDQRGEAQAAEREYLDALRLNPR